MPIQLVDLYTKLQSSGHAIECNLESQNQRVALFQPRGHGSLTHGRLAWQDNLEETIERWFFFLEGVNPVLAVLPELSCPKQVLVSLLEGKLPLPPGCLAVLPLALLSPESFLELADRPEADYTCSRPKVDGVADSTSHWVNSLAYVYNTKNSGNTDRRFSLQLKTYPMSHSAYPFELKNLVLGDEVLWLAEPNGDLGLMSLICSDVLQLQAGLPATLKSRLRAHPTLLLHPQLCPKPLHQSFRSYRPLLYSDQIIGNYLQVLTLNWAAGSTLDDSPLYRDGNYPASCFFQKNTLYADGAETFDNNYEKGLYHHMNQTERIDVFTFHPRALTWHFGIWRNNGTSPIANTNSYPRVLGVWSMDDADTGEDVLPPLTLSHDLPRYATLDSIAQMRPIYRESWISVAACVGAISPQDELTPDRVPTLAGNVDVSCLATFSPGGDVDHERRRDDYVYAVKQLVNHILPNRTLWPDNLQRFSTIELNMNYTGDSMTCTCEGNVPVPVAHAGISPAYEAERRRDDLLKAVKETMGENGELTSVCYLDTNGSIRWVSGGPKADILTGGRSSPRDIFEVDG